MEIPIHFIFFISLFSSCAMCSGISNSKINIIVVSLGDSPAFGFTASAPAYDVAFQAAQQQYPATFQNAVLSWVVLRGPMSCPEATTMIPIIAWETWRLMDKVDGFTVIIFAGEELYFYTDDRSWTGFHTLASQESVYLPWSARVVNYIESFCTCHSCLDFTGCLMPPFLLADFGRGTIMHRLYSQSPISGWSHDLISTVLYHSIRYKSPNDPWGAIVEIESRDRPDMGYSTWPHTGWYGNTQVTLLETCGIALRKYLLVLDSCLWGV